MKRMYFYQVFISATGWWDNRLQFRARSYLSVRETPEDAKSDTVKKWMDDPQLRHFQIEMEVSVEDVTDFILSAIEVKGERLMEAHMWEQLREVLGDIDEV